MSIDSLIYKDTVYVCVCANSSRLLVDQAATATPPAKPPQPLHTAQNKSQEGTLDVRMSSSQLIWYHLVALTSANRFHSSQENFSTNEIGGRGDPVTWYAKKHNRPKVNLSHTQYIHSSAARKLTGKEYKARTQSSL